MAFTIVHGNQEQLQWMPVEPAEVIRTGSIVTVDTATPLEGVQPIGAAAGASNTTNKDIPLGVVVGNNAHRHNVSWDSTNMAEQITQVAAGSVYGSTTEYEGVEGPYAKGDRQAYVLVHRIDPSTVIRGPIFNAAVGTAPSVVTATVASGGDGIGCTTGASDVATVANFATIFIRSGGNRGIYRTLTSASDTAHTWLKAMPTDVAVGDTAVVINGLRPYGISYAQFDAEALYINCAAALTSDYYIIDVRRLDLSEAGNEYVEFTFNADNFCAARA